MGYTRRPISKETRQLVYNKCNGHCAYCGCNLEYKDMQVDHVIAVGRGGSNDIDNLLPACRQCNYDKHEMTIERFRKRISKELYKSLERVFVYRLAKKYNLVKEEPRVVKFYFEQLQDEANKKSGI